MRLIRCKGLCASNGRAINSCGRVGSRPMEIFIRCGPTAQSVSVMNQIMNGCVIGKCCALMFENTPRMVCLPEPGSRWTPSQVSQQSSWGLEFMRRKLGGAHGAAQIILLAEARGADEL